MIAMLMGDQDAVKLVRIFAEQGHAPRDLAGAEARIDQHTGTVSDEQHSVAGRSTTEDRNLHD